MPPSNEPSQELTVVGGDEPRLIAGRQPTVTGLAVVLPSVTDDSSPAAADDSERGIAVQVRQLSHRLEATADVPVNRTASRWLGEAEAIAADAATSDLEDATVRERVATVRELLSEIDDTGHEDADAHLESAKRICRAILESPADEQ
ncbi:hypothetical protein [Natronorubrum sulfidifaciens]